MKAIKKTSYKNYNWILEFCILKTLRGLINQFYKFSKKRTANKVLFALPTKHYIQFFCKIQCFGVFTNSLNYGILKRINKFLNHGTIKTRISLFM